MDNDERHKLKTGLLINNHMDDKIYNDVITIESVEQKNDRVTLVAHNKNRYGFWATRKTKDADGNHILDAQQNVIMEDSAAMTQFKNMGLRKGSTVRIGYVIESYTDKQGINRESKKIINFQESEAQPSQSVPRQESPRGEAPARSQGYSSDTFGRRLALHGMVNGMLAAGATIEVIVKDLPALLQLEDRIDHVLSEEQPDPDADLPTFHQDEDFNDIAF